MSVDLPHPEGPTTVTNSLSAMSSDTPSSATNSSFFRGKVLRTSCTEIFALVVVVIVVPAIR
jgi:hypothetical protein